MTEPVVVRRTFPGDRLTLADLRHLAAEAHDAGLSDGAVIGFRKWYAPGGRAGGWMVEVTVAGTAVLPNVGG